MGEPTVENTALWSLAHEKGWIYVGFIFLIMSTDWNYLAYLFLLN